MSIDERGRKAGIRVRAAAAQIARTDDALASLHSTERSALRTRRWWVWSAAAVAVVVAAAALVLLAREDAGNTVIQTDNVTVATQSVPAVTPTTATDIVVSPSTEPVPAPATSTPMSSAPPSSVVSDVPDGSFDFVVPESGLPIAPVRSLALIPTGSASGEIALQRAEFGLSAVLTPDSIVVLEIDPESLRLSGKGIRLARDSGAIIDEVRLDERVTTGDLAGAVGAADGTIIVRVGTGIDTGFTTLVLAETTPGLFAVVAETPPTTEVGDGAFRPGPSSTAGTEVTFDRLAAGQPAAIVDVNIPPWNVRRFEPNDPTTPTSEWSIWVENGGSSWWWADAFRDGALFVTNRARFTIVDTDIVYLDPELPAVGWRIDGWQLTDHDIADVLVARMTVEGLEIGLIDDDPIVPPTAPTTGNPLAGALEFNLNDDPTSTPSILGYQFGQQLTDSDDVVTDISNQLGTPTQDTGWTELPEQYQCGASEYRSILWDDIRFVLERIPATDGTQIEYLSAWSIGDTTLFYSPPLDATPSTASGITSPEGVAIGAPRSLLDSIGFLQPVLDDGDQAFGLANISPVVFHIDNGTIIGMHIEQNDC